MNHGSLCTGYGGLDMAVASHYGATSVWTADNDHHAAAVIAARYPRAPNLGDLAAVDWASVQPVDIVTAGYPCQPFSTAGKRQGNEDDRHIWPHIIAAIRVLRPRLVVMENVTGHLSMGFGDVLGDLAAAGFDAEWCVLRASDVGAPHQRARVFVVAHASGDGLQGQRRTTVPGERQRAPGGAASGDAANTHSEPAGRDSGTASRPESQDGWWASDDGVGSEDEAGAAFYPWARYQREINRWGQIVGRPAPHPWVWVRGRQLNARFTEWMMGLPYGWVTDLLSNRQALRVIGNGVCPQQALAALQIIGRTP